MSLLSSSVFVPILRLYQNSSQPETKFRFQIPWHIFLDPLDRKLVYSLSSAHTNGQLPLNLFDFDASSNILTLNFTFSDALDSLESGLISAISPLPSNFSSFKGILETSLPISVQATSPGGESEPDLLVIPVLLIFDNVADNQPLSVPADFEETLQVEQNFEYSIPLNLQKNSSINLYQVNLDGNSFNITCLQLDPTTKKISGYFDDGQEGHWKVYVTFSTTQNSGFSVYSNYGKPLLYGIGASFFSFDLFVMPRVPLLSKGLNVSLWDIDSLLVGGFVKSAVYGFLIRKNTYFQYSVPIGASEAENFTVSSFGDFSFPTWLQYSFINGSCFLLGYPTQNYTNDSTVLYLSYNDPLTDGRIGILAYLSLNDSIMTEYADTNVYDLQFIRNEVKVLQIPNSVFSFSSNVSNISYNLIRLNGSVDASFDPEEMMLFVTFDRYHLNQTSVFVLYASTDYETTFYEFLVQVSYPTEDDIWKLVVSITFTVLTVVFLCFLFGYYSFKNETRQKFKAQLFLSGFNTRTAFPREPNYFHLYLKYIFTCQLFSECYEATKVVKTNKLKDPPDIESHFYEEKRSLEDYRDNVDIQMFNIPLQDEFEEVETSTSSTPSSGYVQVIHAEIGKPFHFMYPVNALLFRLKTAPRRNNNDKMAGFKLTSKETPELSRDSSLFGFESHHHHHGKFDLDSEVMDMSRYSGMHRPSYLSFDERSSGSYESRNHSFIDDFSSSGDLSTKPDENTQSLVVISARLASGLRLPYWLHFNSKQGSFYGVPTEFDRMRWDIEIVAQKIDFSQPFQSKCGQRTFTKDVLENKIIGEVSDNFILHVVSNFPTSH